MTTTMTHDQAVDALWARVQEDYRENPWGEDKNPQLRRSEAE
jgi:hypothetical protein